MKNALHILILEDNADDAELIGRTLSKAIPNLLISVATSRDEYLYQLDHNLPDLILADSALPQFSGTEALELLQSKSLGIPFILVTGTVSEEFAAGIIKLGAQDYILKDRLTRLPSSIDSALKKSRSEYEKRETLKRLIESEENYRLLTQELTRKNAELRELSTHLLAVREEERIHIAREIHDELGQQLTGLKMNMQWLQKKLSAAEITIREKIESTVQLINETVVSVRRISSDLRPSMLDDLGLVAALEWHGQQVSKRSEIKVHFEASPPDLTLPMEITTAVFRIYQEALTNAVRHANAHCITSSLSHENGSLQLIIRDDGKGIDMNRIALNKTFGLLGIRERTFMLGGTCELKTEPGKGTEMQIAIPCQIML